MSRPLVSIIVPMYNDAAYADTALASIAAQTFPDFEVVIADDGSSDGSLAIARGWVERDTRFRLLDDREHLGMTPNWNRGLRAAAGKYVSKLDADDLMRPRFVETLAKELEEDPRIHTAFCRSLDCDAALVPYASYLGERAFCRNGLDPLVRKVGPGTAWLAMSFDGFQPWSSNAQLHRRETLEHLGGWDERWWSSDTDLLLRTLLEDGLFVHHPYCGIWYRRRPDSMNDTLEKRGWKSAELALIHLQGLGRYYRRGLPMNGVLWQAWRRYWGMWLDHVERSGGALEALPPSLRDGSVDALTTAVRPPWRVRARYRAGRFARRIARRRTPS